METLFTADLTLEPLVAGHAGAMFEVLSEPELYRYLDHGPPPSLDHLRGVYEQLEARVSPDGSQLWLNWVVRPQGGAPVGFVQATVTGADAWIAYVLAREYWGRGYAFQASSAVIDHLRATCGVLRFLATVDAENERSVRVLRRLGFHAATEAEAREHGLSAAERLFVLAARPRPDGRARGRSDRAIPHGPVHLQKEVAMSSVEEVWAAFRAARPDVAGPQDAYSAWHFCDNQADADELVELVLAGRKRATAGALWSYEAEGEPVPQPGDFSVVTDWSGAARCIIRTAAVDIVGFDAVSEEFAAMEGEGDGSLAFWREAHWAAFSRELAGSERSPQPDMPVVCERFEVVFPV